MPLELRGLAMAHARHGSLPWARLVTPVLPYARDGFPAHPYLIAALSSNVTLFKCAAPLAVAVAAGRAALFMTCHSCIVKRFLTCNVPQSSLSLACMVRQRVTAQCQSSVAADPAMIIVQCVMANAGSSIRSGAVCLMRYSAPASHCKVDF